MVILHQEVYVLVPDMDALKSINGFRGLGVLELRHCTPVEHLHLIVYMNNHLITNRKSET
jgi:hypothetical protein